MKKEKNITGTSGSVCFKDLHIKIVLVNNLVYTRNILIYIYFKHKIIISFALKNKENATHNKEIWRQYHVYFVICLFLVTVIVPYQPYWTRNKMFISWIDMKFSAQKVRNATLLSGILKRKQRHRNENYFSNCNVFPFLSNFIKLYFSLNKDDNST